MSIEERIRSIVEDCDGRAPVERVVRDGLGVAGVDGGLARRLAESAVRDLRGLALDGDAVVVRETPEVRDGLVALALARPSTPTALPPLLAWTPVLGAGEPAVVDLQTDAWRAALTELAADLRGTTVFALSAGSARPVLRLASLLAGSDPQDEPRLVALAPIARALGHPLRDAEAAAALVGEPVPETPDRASFVLARLVEFLAERGGVAPCELADVADREVAAGFDFGERAFGRADVLSLPESPGVYIYEDAEGDVVYVGKSANLRRRVASYFQPNADPRAARIRDAAHRLSHERTGSELSALLREQELIRELRPSLNVQETVHAGPGDRALPSGRPDTLAVVHPSADGGAEVVLLDRQRGVTQATVLVGGGAPAEDLLHDVLVELRRRPSGGDGVQDAEVALRWIAARGAASSLVDATGEEREVAALLSRLAADPNLAVGRIVPVR